MKERRQMRTRVAAVALALPLAATAAAQEKVAIDDLTAPTSPAFVLLDVSPASVERPDNAKTLTLNLINRLSTSKGLPQNYALEVAPYWLASHTDLTFTQYQSPSPLQSIAQSFMVSVATVPIPGATTPADPTGIRLGIGFRAHIWNGKSNQKLAEVVAELADVNGQILDAINIQAGSTSTPGQIRQAKEEEQQARIRAKKLALDIQGLDAERVGFFFAIAAGQTWAYPGDDISRGHADTRGVWATPSYRIRACSRDNDSCEASVDVIGVVRALMETDKDTRWDYGGRFVWRAKRDFYLSVESLGRRDNNSRTAAATATAAADNRTVGILEYRIRQDLVLYGSFGRDFIKDNGVRPLVSLLGLNLGFGSKPVVTADRKQ
jgi:hypothetical protein